MNEEGNTCFKLFSPLRTPDVLKFVKHKHKKKDKIQKGESDSDGTLTKDILKLASKVSGKLSKPKLDKFAFKSSEFPVEISPGRLQLLSSRLDGPVDAVPLTPSSTLTSDQLKVSGLKMHQKSPKKHKKRKDHSMSESEDDLGVKSLVSDTQEYLNESQPESPSLLSSTTVKGSENSFTEKHKKNKKKHKRAKEHSKKVSDSDFENSNNSQDNCASPSQGDTEETSSQEEMTTPVNKQLSSIRHMSADNSLSAQEFKYQVPKEFRTTETTEKHVSFDEIKGKELWLIKAPSDLDMTALSGVNVSLDKESHFKNTENEPHDVLPIPGDLPGVPLCPMIPHVGSSKFTAGTEFCGQLHIMKSVKVPPLAEVRPPSPPYVEPPGDLRPRYIPFGADVTHMVIQQKHKKSKKRKHSTSEADSSSKHHKKKKKHKHKDL